MTTLISPASNSCLLLCPIKRKKESKKGLDKPAICPAPNGKQSERLSGEKRGSIKMLKR